MDLLRRQIKYSLFIQADYKSNYNDHLEIYKLFSDKLPVFKSLALILAFASEKINWKTNDITIYRKGIYMEYGPHAG
jgi:hypothetical protein